MSAPDDDQPENENPPNEPNPADPSESTPSDPNESNPKDPNESSPSEPNVASPPDPNAANPSDPSAANPSDPSAANPSDPSAANPTAPTGGTRQRVTAWYTVQGWDVNSFVDAGMVDSVIVLIFRLEPTSGVINTFSKKGPMASQNEFTDADRKKIASDVKALGAFAIAEFGYAISNNAAYAPMNALLGDPAAQAALKQAVLDEVDAIGWDGVSFDVENVGSTQSPKKEQLRDAWTAWLRDLSAALHKKNKLCTVTAPGKWTDDGFLAQSNAHDWRALFSSSGGGEPLDWLVAMGYDDSGSLTKQNETKIIDYAASTCGLDKFVLGVDGTHTADATVTDLAKLCHDKGCGFSRWTIGAAKASWKNYADAVNPPPTPGASKQNQPKQTPSWLLTWLGLAP